ncbi:MAG: acetyl-CoA carboxylase carboxyltransferase subunit beta [Planctomycetes bacterium]|nr:acetyl-CoA carboxylase carboxyltransferase subunit beta [Planctomycetota bacterium]
MAFEKIKKILRRKKELPGGLWMKCPDCGNMIYKKDVENRKMVCPDCAYHFSIAPQERVDLMLDPGTWTRLWSNLAPVDALRFEGITSYRQKMAAAQKETGEKDAIWAGTGRIEGRPVVFGVTDSRFMMGSMGSVLGEGVTRMFEYGLQRRLPVLLISGSGGGARMYEGCLSLMQMAKTSAAIARFSDAGGLYISVLTNPTMAGVMASFASLGDVMIAEPKALIGFTGPRVIEQTIRQELPKGFQTSEFLLDHGFVDMVVPRERLRQEVARLLDYLG